VHALFCTPLETSSSAIEHQHVYPGHMAREEADVLPLLEARLCTKQQRDMVWRTLQAMPLRLLERVLPWLAGSASSAYYRIVMCHCALHIVQAV